MLRRTIVILATVMAMSSGFVSNAMARGGGGGGGHGGGFGGGGGHLGGGFAAGSAVNGGFVGGRMGNFGTVSHNARVGASFGDRRFGGGWWDSPCGYNEYYYRNNLNSTWCAD
jgi:hypothetical protein